SLVSGLTATSYTYSGFISDGTHSWSITAVGCLNTTATSTSRTLLVDRTQPAVFDLTAPTSGVWVKDTTALSWQASSDPASGLASYTAYLSGAANVTINAGSSETTANFSAGTATEGTYNWY